MATRFVPHASAADAALLEVSGAIASEDVRTLDAAFQELARQGKRQVVLDCSGVRYVNSSGIAVLVKRAQELDAAGGGLSLLGVPRKVSIVLEMLGLDEGIFACLCEHRPGAFVRAA